MKIHQLRRPIKEYEDDDAPQFQDDTLQAGTVVYHGTGSTDFDERVDDLYPPLWVSDSPQVAEWFAKRFQQGARSRVITYEVSDDMRLLVVDSHTFQEIEDFYGFDMQDPHEIAENICRLGYDGWVIPFNYPEGDDIMLCRPSLSYVQTTPTG